MQVRFRATHFFSFADGPCRTGGVSVILVTEFDFALKDKLEAKHQDQVLTEKVMALRQQKCVKLMAMILPVKAVESRSPPGNALRRPRECALPHGVTPPVCTRAFVLSFWIVDSWTWNRF
jgi:hypothetical protein